MAGDSGDSFRVVCETVAGLGDLSQMLPGEEVMHKYRKDLRAPGGFVDSLVVAFQFIVDLMMRIPVHI